jgi:TonB family protein
MEKPIVNVELKFACPMNWDEMGNATGGKNCDACKKKVYDLTDCDQGYLDQLLANNNYSICGRFTAKQVAAPPLKQFAWKKWISAALVLMGFNVLNNQAAAQTITAAIATTASIKEETFLLGEVAIVGNDPEFKGGKKALNKFIKNNIRYQGQNGEVIVSFVIDAAGRVTKPDIEKGLDNASNAEALRLVNLLPKWQPARVNGEAVARVYVLPLLFKTK